MAIRIHKRISGTLRTLALLSWIVLLDRSYLFPLQSHSDLKFRVIGECIELLALAGILFLMPALMRLGGVSQSTSLTFRSRLAMGGWLASLMFVLFWRDFFPNDHLSLVAGRLNFLYGPAYAVMVVAISYLLGPRLPKLSNRDEKSVV